jgi:hypothetical protein
MPKHFATHANHFATVRANIDVRAWSISYIYIARRKYVPLREQISPAETCYATHRIACQILIPLLEILWELEQLDWQDKRTHLCITTYGVSLTVFHVVQNRCPIGILGEYGDIEYQEHRETGERSETLIWVSKQRSSGICAGCSICLKLSSPFDWSPSL